MRKCQKTNPSGKPSGFCMGLVDGGEDIENMWKFLNSII
jgi:hypothetical protein